MLRYSAAGFDDIGMLCRSGDVPRLNRQTVRQGRAGSSQRLRWPAVLCGQPPGSVVSGRIASSAVVPCTKDRSSRTRTPPQSARRAPHPRSARRSATNDASIISQAAASAGSVCVNAISCRFRRPWKPTARPTMTRRLFKQPPDGRSRKRSRVLITLSVRMDFFPGKRRKAHPSAQVGDPPRFYAWGSVSRITSPGHARLVILPAHSTSTPTARRPPHGPHGRRDL